MARSEFGINDINNLKCVSNGISVIQAGGGVVEDIFLANKECTKNKRSINYESNYVNDGLRNHHLCN